MRDNEAEQLTRHSPSTSATLPPEGGSVDGHPQLATPSTFQTFHNWMASISRGTQRLAGQSTSPLVR